MGWRRSLYDKRKKENLIISSMEEKGMACCIHKTSPNADNRHYCWGCNRDKYCYKTKQKAEKATEFVPNKQRVYYCKSCCAWHTTKILDITDLKHLCNGFTTIDVPSEK